jgi:hypothetical protein
MSDSPVKSNAEVFEEYTRKREEHIIAKTLETEDTVRRLKKDGVDEETARKEVKEAANKNKDLTRIKAKDILAKGRSLVTTYRNIGIMGAGCLPLLVAFMCILPLLMIVALTATAVSNPTSILTDECKRRGAVNMDDGINCVRSKYLNNNGTSFQNQGLTI